jgi:hypothetical protein
MTALLGVGIAAALALALLAAGWLGWRTWPPAPAASVAAVNDKLVYGDEVTLDEVERIAI